MSLEYYIAWWNVENLFDIENSQLRIPILQDILADELIGWDTNILDLKIAQLVDIIQNMNNGLGPDILGVCEVENESVLSKLANAINLPNRKYEIAHHDGSDQRGIEVGFIFDENKFIKGNDYSHVVLLRYPTRDIFMVEFTTKTNNRNEIIIIGNHWPARTNCSLFDEPYRIVAAESLVYWHSQIRKTKCENTPILVMGDFNDEPFNRSMTQYLLSSRSKQKVKFSSNDKPRLFNLMWNRMGEEYESYYYNNNPLMVDQFLVSRGFLDRNSAFSVDQNSVEIIHYPRMTKGRYYKTPKRFGRPSKGLDLTGYSDHFPIGMKIIEE